MRIEYRETPASDCKFASRKLFIVGDDEGIDYGVWICWIESRLDSSDGWSEPQLHIHSKHCDMTWFSREEWERLIKAAEMAWNAWKEKVWE